MKYTVLSASALVLSILSGPALAQCPALLDHTMQRLHSSESVSLCDELAGKPALIVNTASHCGFTHQFSGLEALHQQYASKGVGFLGVASNSFNQAAKSEAEAAEVCYVNYGVSFTMLSKVPVAGSEAHPMFQQLAAGSSPPTWNFNKFVLDADGEVVERFGASVAPDDPRITGLLDQLIAEAGQGGDDGD